MKLALALIAFAAALAYVGMKVAQSLLRGRGVAARRRQAKRPADA